jgi:FixJ family two-component response regulator
MAPASACVSVVDDDILVLRSIGRLLQSAGFSVATYSSSEEFLRGWAEKAPGCVVMDLAMPGLTGLELQRALVDAAEAPQVVFISGTSDVPSSVEAMKRGAVDFLTKPLDEARFLGAVHAALERHRNARERHAVHASITTRLVTLTPREREVLAGVVAGKLNKQIAAELGTAEKTIKVHRARMMRKMQVESVAELVTAWTLTQPPRPV